MGGSPINAATAPVMLAAAALDEPVGNVDAVAAPPSHTPPAKPSLRVQAPPLPDNAFAHLHDPQAPVVPSAIMAVSSALPPAAPSPVTSPLPYVAPIPSSVPSSSPYPATNGLGAPAFPVGLDYPMPASEAIPRAPAVPAMGRPGHVSPQSYNPWAAPLQEAPGSPFVATDTTGGLVLEERQVPTSKISKGEIALWTLVMLAATTVICHRNGVFRQWFGPNAYSLLEAQVIGKPSLETVAGVRALVAELGAADDSER